MDRCSKVTLASFLVLSLLSFNALAESSPAAEAFLASLSPTGLAAGGPSKEPPSATRASSTALCKDGSTVTCTGSSTSAVDANCAVSQRGYCWGSSTGYRYCPACTCDIQLPCSNGSWVWCTGTIGCYGVPYCWVECDGQQTWCSGAPWDCPI